MRAFSLDRRQIVVRIREVRNDPCARPCLCGVSPRKGSHACVGSVQCLAISRDRIAALVRLSLGLGLRFRRLCPSTPPISMCDPKRESMGYPATLVSRTVVRHGIRLKMLVTLSARYVARLRAWRLQMPRRLLRLPSDTILLAQVPEPNIPRDLCSRSLRAEGAKCAG